MTALRLRSLAVVAVLLTEAAAGGVIESVQKAISLGNEAAALRALQEERTARGVTAELAEAMSWLARAEFDSRRYNQAARLAQETYQLAAGQWKQKIRSNAGRLETALGAAIEVQGRVMAATGRLSEAVPYLESQAKAYAGTALETRIHKNLLLLTLEGKPAPPLERMALPFGKPALLFFWAHWCPDCKAEAPVLAALKREFGGKGLTILGPTQKYGYVAGGRDAAPSEETAYIEQIRRTFYAAVVDGPPVVNEANFVRYGASTTPTLVLVDRMGIVRLYHPGAMTYAELRAAIQRVM